MTNTATNEGCLARAIKQSTIVCVSPEPEVDKIVPQNQFVEIFSQEFRLIGISILVRMIGAHQNVYGSRLPSLLEGFREP